MNPIKRPPKFLLIEDNREVASLVRSALLEHTPDVVVYHTATEAMAAATHPRAYWDLVVLDVVLGGDVDGLDVLPYFRKRKSAWAIAILSDLQSRPSTPRARNLHRTAASAFFAERLTVVAKPPDNNQLHYTVQTILSWYEDVDRKRYMFAPGPPGLWLVRFNGGPIMPLQNHPGCNLIHRMLQGESISRSDIAASKEAAPNRKHQGSGIPDHGNEELQQALDEQSRRQSIPEGFGKEQIIDLAMEMRTGKVAETTERAWRKLLEAAPRRLRTALVAALHPVEDDESDDAASIVGLESGIHRDQPTQENASAGDENDVLMRKWKTRWPGQFAKSGLAECGEHLRATVEKLDKVLWSYTGNHKWWTTPLDSDQES